MATAFDRELEERLVRYVAIDTQSDEASPTSPSTSRQFALLHLLRDELAAMGARDVRLTDYGAVLATVPGTRPAPTIAWLAHVDTAPQFRADGVKPLVRRRYDGGDIRFPDAPDLVLSPEVSPYLGARLGDDIVTASGTTLLGADDKAGVAIVMTAARRLLTEPGAHGPIRLAFTSDEEIGRGVPADLPQDIGAAAGYTFDGGERGELTWESFSADKAVVTVTGVSIPRHGQRQARQRAAPRRPDRRRVAAGHAHARDNRGARWIHPPLRTARHGGAGAELRSSFATSSARGWPPMASW